MSAIERYDGPSFKVLRKFFRMNETNLEVYILSAKYGLIPANKKITMYDMILNPEKAEKVKPEIASELEKLELNRYESIFLSKIYLLALPEIDENIEKSIFKIQAPQGKRLTLLKQWLWHDNIEHSPECKPVKRDKPNNAAK